MCCSGGETYHMEEGIDLVDQNRLSSSSSSSWLKGERESFKVVILGKFGSGKTSLILRYIHQQFFSVYPTIGAAYHNKVVPMNDRTIELQIWDTAGGEQFHSLAPMYCRGSSVVLLVFDVTDRGSFEQLDEWEKDLKSASLAEDAIFMVVGAKIDLERERRVSKEAARKWCRTHLQTKKRSPLYHETSAFEGIGVDEMFGLLLEELVKKEKVECRR